MKINQRTPPRHQRAADPPPQFDSSDLGSPKKVWSLLCEKDWKLARNPQMFVRQKKINARMRSMLLDWLMDVCADKHLHRETFHLCIDYIDRYIATLDDQQVLPQRLQLIGSTALVIATKVEEIYPPKINEIADYSDGCCTEQDIKSIEEVMLEKLDWTCHPITAVHWLALYMQLMNTSEVLPARHVIISAAKRTLDMHSSLLSADSSAADGDGAIADQFASLHAAPPSLDVSILSALNDENDQPSPAVDVDHCGKQQQRSVSVSFTPSPLHNHSTTPPSSPGRPFHQHQSKPSTGGECVKSRRISFSCAYPRVQLSHIGSSPRVFLHTTQADITYVGNSSYSNGHIYPDQRCTVPKLMRGEFVRMASILDLVLLDADSLRFRYSELATAVVLCCYEPEHLICQITGFSSDKVHEVRAYIEPFVEVFDRLEPAGTAIPCTSDVHSSDRHNIQTYTQNNLNHLEAVEKLRKEIEARRKALDRRVVARVRKRKFGTTMSANQRGGGAMRIAAANAYK